MYRSYDSTAVVFLDHDTIKLYAPLLRLNEACSRSGKNKYLAHRHFNCGVILLKIKEN